MTRVLRLIGMTAVLAAAAVVPTGCILVDLCDDWDDDCCECHHHHRHRR